MVTEHGQGRPSHRTKEGRRAGTCEAAKGSQAAKGSRRQGGQEQFLSHFQPVKSLTEMSCRAASPTHRRMRRCAKKAVVLNLADVGDLVTDRRNMADGSLESCLWVLYSGEAATSLLPDARREQERR